MILIFGIVTVNAEESVTITVWRGDLGPAWAKFEQEIVSEFEKAHPNINIEQTPMPWNTFREKLLTAFRFGGEELPNLIWEGLNMTERYASVVRHK